MEQLSIFDFTRHPFKIDKPIRLISLFSGYDSQAMALKRLGVNFEHYRAVEFDKYAMASLNAIHGTNFPVTDIRDVHADDLGIIDKDKYCYLVTYSAPCFTKDMLILCESGFKRIEDVKVNDYVLSHDNQYHRVSNQAMTGHKETLKIKGMGIDEIVCTKNHKFYVRQIHRFNTHRNGIAVSGRTFDKPIWIEADQLSKSYYMGVAINQKSIIPDWDGIDFGWKDGRKTRHKNQLSQFMNNSDFWWVIGAYVGDGWIRNNAGIIICGNPKKIKDIRERADRLGLNYSESKERTVSKLHFGIKELEKFVMPFGKGASNKHIPGFVFDLPKELLKSFLDGYMNADGCYTQGLYKATSVSRELIYGIGQIVGKVYNRPYSIYKNKLRPISVIEERTVTNKQQWTITWKTEKKKQDKAFFEDGYVWFPITSVEQYESCDVYDITVDDSHSFTVNGVIAHNCTDISRAGEQKGFEEGSGTRSSMLWEVKRLLQEMKAGGQLPDVLLMENVDSIHDEGNRKLFMKWINALEDIGYVNYQQDLTAYDFGIPQNRTRTFVVSLLGEYNYKFPREMPLRYCIENFYEDLTEEQALQLVVKSEKAHALLVELNADGKLEKAD